MIQILPPATGRSAICEPILRALPSWFGIEEANQMYLRDIEARPTLLALWNGQPAGFLTITRHSDYAAEIHVMGVLPALHRHGIGRSMQQAAESYLHEQGIEFLQVKTLSSRHPDEGYKKTRAFYLAMGFKPLEEFPDLWGEHNPCLQLIKTL